jgi:RES domain-containing protein
MVRRVYRVCRAIHAQFDGEGARQVGGRWNRPGSAVVYMAESVSLAVLENLVHMSRDDFPIGYVVLAAAIPDEIRIARVDQIASREIDIGEAWLGAAPTAVLRVPSRVVPSEYLYLLNPRHPDFSQISVEEIRPFTFDPRLFQC